VRRAVLAAFLLCLLAAAPAGAHGLGGHGDSRAELARMDVAGVVAALDASAGLPTAWCGDRVTSDSPGADVSLPRFKVVYAYAAGSLDRSGAWSDALQADVSTLSRFVGAQSGGSKAPRFDMGSSCGAQYLDIQVVALPAARSAYVDDFDAVEAAVSASLNTTPGGRRNTIVLADQLSGSPVGYWRGEATLMGDDSPGSGNAANSGSLFSILWVPSGEAVHQAGWWPEGMLHEMTHNMGGVQLSAPHTSGRGHCWDGWDVMCYADGGPTAMQYPCATIAGAMSKTYDCGGDDYFNPAPAGGSYLATHWNVYRSVFLAGCAEVAPACGESGGATLAPPVSTAHPAISGSAREGSTLAATTGTWLNAPTAYAYQWQRAFAGAYADIPGATSASYTLRTSDVGARLRVLVVASNGDGNVVDTSEETAVVTALPVLGAPVPTPSATATASPVATATPAVLPVPALTAPAWRSGVLRMLLRRGRAKRLATVRFTAVAGRVKVAAVRVRLAKGHYVLKLCANVCVRRYVTVRRTAKVRLPGLSAPGLPIAARFTLTRS
jgi:hypothetical protein